MPYRHLIHRQMPCMHVVVQDIFQCVWEAASPCSGTGGEGAALSLPEALIFRTPICRVNNPRGGEWCWCVMRGYLPPRFLRDIMPFESCSTNPSEQTQTATHPWVSGAFSLSITSIKARGFGAQHWNLTTSACSAGCGLSCTVSILGQNLFPLSIVASLMSEQKTQVHVLQPSPTQTWPKAWL